MQRIKQTVTDYINQSIKNKFAGIEGNAVSESMLDYPPDANMGDLTLPCFKLSKTLRRAPAMIADAIAEGMRESSDGCPAVSKIESVNGYLNIFLSDQYLASEILGEISQKGDKYGSSGVGIGKKAVFDYSSPNVAKPFHIGHLGTTVIGHALKKIHEFAGYECVGINYLGDWGTQFGKLITAFRLWGNKEAVENKGIDELVALYVKFHEEAEKDDTLNDKARAEFRKLESNDEENIALWKWFVDISIKEYKKTYALLGIEFDSYKGESFYTDKMPAQVELLRQKGLLKIDDGASIVDLSEHNMPPCLILKRDGSTLYPTRDIAAAVYRKQVYDFDKCVYVTSAGQSLHFAQWFKVVELMGYDWHDKLVHVPYGTVSVNGEKLATRTGNVILLKDLFAMAIDKVEAIINEKNPALEDKRCAAEAVGVGAIIFYYLLGNRMRDISFNLEEALSYEGNTGPYVQYTYARTCSLLEKAGSDGKCKADGVEITAPEESDLLKVLARFPEKVDSALESYEPFVVVRYILELASAYNRFYHNCKILNADDEKVKYTRIQLTAATNSVLGTAFELVCLKKIRKI